VHAHTTCCSIACVREVEIGVPSVAARRDILTAVLRRFPHALADGVVAHCAAVTHGYVGADIVALVKEAAMSAVRRAVGDASSPVPGDVLLCVS
jgi:AAA family ATPase